MDNIQKQQIEQWARIYNDTFVNESLDFSDSDQRELKQLMDKCNKNYRLYKNSENQFKKFEFEGQALANAWDMLGSIAESLLKGYKNSFVLGYLDALNLALQSADSHKLPKPTDSRDIA